MYREHFGLDRLPFTTTPDPTFHFQTSQNRHASGVLRCDLPTHRPVCVVTGDVGMGKTALIGHVLSDVPRRTAVGLIRGLPTELDDILPWILDAFGLRGSRRKPAGLESFEDFLRKETSAGRRCVLIIDEAQNLSDRGLERLRSLVNVTIGSNMSFGLVLVGQNALRARLESPAGGPLAKQVGFTAMLGPMNADETGQYVRHRLSVVGAEIPIFDEAALAAVHQLSGGCPRVVNTVCGTAMYMAARAGERAVGRTLIGSLADSDGVLSHLAGTDRATPAGPGLVTGTTSDDGRKPAVGPVLLDYLGQDVFDFALSRQHKAAAKMPDRAAREPGDLPGAPDRDAETAMPASDAPATPVARARPEALPTGIPSVSMPRAAVLRKRRQDRLPRGAPRSAGRVSFRRFLSGTIAASAVAAGGLLFTPFAVRDAAGPDPAGQVSMQQVSALALVPSNAAHAKLPDPPAPLPDMSGPALLDRAIDAGFTDPASAALDYARAALRGEARAAYFLGQLYETGDGVPRDLALARGWYSSVEESVRGARRRLKDLGSPIRTGELAPPRPLLGGTLDSGGAEFVWTSGDGADPAFYVVELSDGPASSVRRLWPQEISALRVDSVGDARFWRVFAVALDMHSYAASDWVPLGAVSADTPLGPGRVVPEAVVQLPADAAPELLAEVTDGLANSRISYRVESGAQGAVDDSGLQIGYFFEADEAAARKIAELVGAQSSVMLATAGGTDPSRPFPGQVVIRATDR